MPKQRLTPEIAAAAIDGYELQKTRIDAKIAELRAMLPGGSTEPAVTSEPKKRKRRKFSAETRRRMKDAQQRRWAKIRGESEPPASAKPEPPKAKRKLSKAGRAAIVAALKKRRAAKKAEAAKAKPAVAKKVAPKKPAVKKVVAKKVAAKKTAPVAAQAGTQTA